MTIKRAAAWIGGMSATYEDEVSDWVSKHLDAEEESVRFDLRRTKAKDFLWEQSPLSSMGSWLFSKRVLILDYVNDLTDKELAPIIANLDESDLDFYVAFIKSGDSLKSVMRVLTEDPKERIVPYGDPKAQQQWIRSWLGQRDITITNDDALRLANYCAEDYISQVNVVTSLALNLGLKGTILHWENDIEPVLGDVGAFDFFTLFNAIESGDRKKAIEAVERSATSLSARGVLGFIKKIYMTYATALDSTKSANELMGYTKSSFFAARKAGPISKKMGAARVAKCMEIIAEAEENITQNFYNEILMVQILVSRLAQQSYLANRR